MTKSLASAIAKARKVLKGAAGIAPLDDETRSAIRQGLAQARRGEFVPDEEIRELWKRHSR